MLSLENEEHYSTRHFSEANGMRNLHETNKNTTSEVKMVMSVNAIE